ncbi:hypothetical protein [Aeromonas veronii]|uniref:hypothetical protein n=1 Tax=Aeromonas veronii TaxID=654 RepID=UPI002443A5BA|nr:hypothetical protein [Aeromonas veronii]
MRPYIILLAAAVTFSASALQIGDFFHNAEVIKANSVKIVNDSLIKVNTTIKGYAANAPYAIKTVDVPKPTFMSHVKSNVNGLVKKNAWYAAWFASMAAAGWAIDELTGQMSVTTQKKRGGCYTTTGGLSFHGSDMAFGACLDAIKKSIDGSNVGRFTFISSTGPNPTQVNGKERLVFSVKYVDNWTGREWFYEGFIEVTSSESKTEPVSDQSLYDSLASFMLQDPKAAAQAFMVPDAWPYPYPHIFPDPVKYIPGVSEADEALLDALIKGQLQTTNPNAANYVTPEKLQQLQTMLSQLQQGITPEGQVGTANDKLKDPITQAQLEETLKKEKEAEAKADQEAATKAQEALKPAEGALDKLSEEKTWLEEQIKEAANQAPPSSAPIFPQWVWPVGNCKPFPFTFTISGLTAKANDYGLFLSELQ